MPDLICSPDAVFERVLEAGGLKVRVSRAVALPYGDALNASIRHLKQFVVSDSETLRSLEAGIGNRTRTDRPGPLWTLSLWIVVNWSFVYYWGPDTAWR